MSLVVLADSVGLLWVFNKIQNLPEKFITYAHKLIWLGITVSIVTGAFMFWNLREYLLSTPAFYTKMFFLLALMINAFLISKHLKKALTIGSFALLEPKHKKSFIISGFVSALSWIAVVISATQLGL